MFSQTARQILMQEVNVEGPSNQMALEVCAVYEMILVHLGFILGEEGGLALFRNSLRRTQSAFPFYAEVVAVERQTLLAALKACLQKQIPACILEASIALLATFLELLGHFIGERLTAKLLQNAWPDIDPLSPRETPK